MGYTHYFHGLTATSQVVADATKIIEASGVTICGPQGEGLPLLSETHGIKLNGFAAAGEAYETFSLPSANAAGRGNHAWFCKTENKPYDLVVTAILTAAALRHPGILRSDGHWESWTAGLALYEAAVRPLSLDQKIALELDIEAMRPEHR
ncbi:hypothetical protein ACTHQ6_09800 [Arthrobacter sp. SAFR-179]|uniref:hypothetical protein n=1 Tax=Arthrobacter sp. SAFR-179 TaxID=3387279 RepID=UPI003F7C4398